MPEGEHNEQSGPQDRPGQVDQERSKERQEDVRVCGISGDQVQLAQSTGEGDGASMRE